MKLGFKPQVVILGVGGIGCATARALAQEGIDRMLLIDNDQVEPTNLQRQCLYSEDDVGSFKVKAAKARLKKINPGIILKSLVKKIELHNMNMLRGSIVLDCTDNLETRYLMNSFCAREKIPWVYCSVAGDHGFIKAITPKTACLECFYKSPEHPETPKTVGILNSAVFFAASIQVSLAQKILKNEPIEDVVYSFNVMVPTLKKIKTMKNPQCRVCR